MRQGAARPELALAIAGPGSPAAPPVLRPPHPAVDVWRDNTGGVCAYTYPAGDQFCMDWPGIARFCFDASGQIIRAWPEPGQRLSSVQRVHRRAVVPAALQHLGFETLHASAAGFAPGVVGFVGAAGAGKSTMARACATAGADHWADDTLVLEVGQRGTAAISIPFDVALRTPSQQHFAGDAGPVVMTGRLGRSDLVALVLLDRGAPGVAVERVSPVQALEYLLPHACTFTMRDARRRRAMVEQYLTLVSAVPVWHLRYPSDFTRLAEVVEVIGRDVAGSREAGRE